MSGGDDGGGSHPWPWAYHRKGDEFTPWPMSKSGTPTAIKDLIGRKVRVVRRDEKEPQGYEPGRVSFLVDDQGRIVNVFFESGLPTE